MRKLAWFTAGFAGMCLVCCYGAPGRCAPLLAAACALALPVLILRVLLRERPAAQSPGFAVLRRALAVLLGAAAAAGWSWGYDVIFRSPAAALAGETLSLTGTVASWPAETSIGGYSMTVELSGGLAAPDVLVYGSAEWGILAPGDRVYFTARLAGADQIRGEETTYYTARGIHLLGYVNGPPELAERPDLPPVRYWPAHCAGALKRSLSAAFPADAAPLAIALVTGDKSGLDKGLNTYLSRAGASHAVVVSGMHISALVTLFLLLARNRRRYAAVMLPVLLFYALMAGGTPSAMRAVVMQGVLLAAPFAKREYDLPTSLSFALLVLLLQNPCAAGSVSLQLSFAACAGLLTVSLPLSKRWSDGVRRWSRGLPGKRRRVQGGAALFAVNALSVSLGAMAFTQPVLAFYFGQASLVFPLTNLLILWAVQLLLPCALLTGVLGLLLPGLAGALGWLFGWLGRYVVWVVCALGRMRYAAVQLSEPAWLIFTAGAWLVLLAALLPRRERGRARPIVPAACIGVLFFAAAMLARWPVTSSRLTAAALDVGQGASTAFVSGGRTCLVDCGGDRSESAGDIAANWFASLGVRRLDVLVLTHFDADHVNGLARLLDRMEVGTVVLPAAGHEPEKREAVLALVEAEGARTVVSEGEDPERLPLGDAILTVWPPMSGGTSNEEGLFVLCSAGEFDALVTGDADAFVEKMLVKYCQLPDIELLAVGHHGAAGSCSEALLDAVRPELAVISAGRNNRYGHPSPETLSRLDQREVEVYRTDLRGTVCVHVTDGADGGYEINIR